MCDKTARLRSIFDRRNAEVARQVAELFGGTFPKFVDDMVAGKEPVRFRFPDREGNCCFGYTPAEAMRAAHEANCSY